MEISTANVKLPKINHLSIKIRPTLPRTIILFLSPFLSCALTMTTPFSSLSHWTYPSLIVDRHPVWYFFDADIFLSHYGLVFGLHRRIFGQSVHFNRLLSRNDPIHHIPIGTTCFLPIVIDQVPLQPLLGFLTLVYYPDFYHGTQTELEQVHQLCVDWKFPKQSAIIVRKLVELRQEELPVTHRTMLKDFVVQNVYRQLRLRRQRTYIVFTEEEFDDSSSDSDEGLIVEDD
jgi:hypothetical protein